MTTDDIVMAEKKRLIENKTYLELIRSLQKRKGQFAECIWIGESMSGTFSYVPTGFDYWTAVNQDHDVSNLNFVRKSAGSYQLAIKYLAEKYPAGVTCDYGDPRPFTEDEKTKIKKELAR